MNNFDNSVKKIKLNCPLPKSDYDKIIMAHGGGGKLSSQLIQKFFFSQFDNELLKTEHDGAVFEINEKRIAFTTDSYVVQPIFFPGGDIGRLAINGTINDLSVCGAKPLYISAGFILEEGFLIEDLWKIILSMKEASENAGIKIVTGDTKVVERGKGDKIYINTSGIGIVRDKINISPKNCQPGDFIILNGNIAEHGIAILSARQSFHFQTSIISDTAPLNDLVNKILSTSSKIHMMRDPTRGGISSSLNEIAKTSGLGIELDETQIPIKEEVKGICELLGFDPLYVANEGKVLVFVPEEDVDKVLAAMLDHQFGRESKIIGRVTQEHPGIVYMKTVIGTNRIVDMLSGEQLPRIC